ncbi:MAG: DinB family protein [Planctomycetota bacterium]|jgi:uncharacterized damage-inducible protein DinB
MIELLSRMLKTEHEANVVLLDFLTDADAEPLQIMQHIIEAQDHYLSRWQGRSEGSAETHGPWSLRRCRQEEDATAAAWQDWLNNITEADLAWKLEQENPMGLFELSASDMVVHVVTHGFYHRAQIDMLLRKSGRELPRAGYAYLARSRTGDPPGENS